MSDELTPELASELDPELTAALRELAVAGETQPPVSGAGIRSRAARRRRRRRTAVTVSLAGACAATGVAVLLALNLGDGGARDHSSPAASPAATTGAPTGTPAAADVTVDLARRVLTAGGRKVPVSSGRVLHPTATGRMTVVAKQSTRVLSAVELGLKGEYTHKVSWVVEFRAADGTTNFAAALDFAPKAPGNYDATSGWIGLRPDDAKWLYGQLDPGAVVEITDGVSPASEASTAADPAPSVTGSVAGTGAVGATPAPGSTDTTGAAGVGPSERQPVVTADSSR